MPLSRWSLVVPVVVSTALVAACTSSGGSTRSGRTGPRPPGTPPGAVIVRTLPCFLTKPIVAVLKRTKLEKYWQEMEAQTEAPMRSVIERDTLAKEALASLEQGMLTRHEWTLTRYMVRVLRELKATNLEVATKRLRSDVFLRAVLRHVSWDGPSALDVVMSVRAETIELIEWLDETRVGGGPDAGQAQKVVDELLQYASVPEPYSVGGQWCSEPDDAGTPEPEPQPEKPPQPLSTSLAS